jgi:hypothetical protein
LNLRNIEILADTAFHGVIPVTASLEASGVLSVKTLLQKAYAKKIVCIGRDLCLAQFVRVWFVFEELGREQERVSFEIIR